MATPVRVPELSSCERTKEVYFLKQAAIGQVVARRVYTYSSAPGHCEQGMQYQDKAYQYDPVGNVLIELNADGTGPQMIEMEAFGTVRYGGQSGPRLTTKHYDSSAELYYFGARWYDPVVGQWIQKEPLGLDGPNLYHYVFNDPINYLDPNGLAVRHWVPWVPPWRDSDGDGISDRKDPKPHNPMILADAPKAKRPSRLQDPQRQGYWECIERCYETSTPGAFTTAGLGVAGVCYPPLGAGLAAYGLILLDGCMEACSMGYIF